MLQRLIGKGVRALQRKRVQRKLKPKDSNKKTVKKDTARVQAEAQAGAKRADRGTKTKQVAKRVLPEMSKVRSQLKGMSANDIAEKYFGTEIMSMIRKVQNPQLKARLQKAHKIRTKGNKQWETREKGEKFTRGQELRFKTNKSGGTVKRKAGGRIGMGAALRGGGAVRKK
tara:strand:+ start:181 stop:693 length:513 start_codon:yes stop_codon:yes gene_type:complete